MCDPLCTACCRGQHSSPLDTCPPPCSEVKESKSRELRGGILYTTCECVKRNGLQDYCPLRQCQGKPECMVKPDPICPAAYRTRKFLKKQAEFAVRASTQRNNTQLSAERDNADVGSENAACCMKKKYSPYGDEECGGYNSPQQHNPIICSYKLSCGSNHKTCCMYKV